MRTFKFFSTANNTQFVALSVATLLLIQQFADAQRSGGGSSGGGGGGYSGGGGGGYSGGGGGYSSGGYYYRSGSGGSGGSCDSECGKALGIGFGAAIGGIIFLCLVAAACCNRNKIMDWLRSCDLKPIDPELYESICKSIERIPSGAVLLTHAPSDNLAKWIEDSKFFSHASVDANGQGEIISNKKLSEVQIAIIQKDPQRYLDDVWRGVALDPNPAAREKVPFDVLLTFLADESPGRFKFFSGDHKDRYGKFRIKNGVLDLDTQRFVAVKQYYEPSQIDSSDPNPAAYSIIQVGIIDIEVRENDDLEITPRGRWYSLSQPYYQGVLEYKKTNPISLATALKVDEDHNLSTDQSEGQFVMIPSALPFGEIADESPGDASSVTRNPLSEPPPGIGL